jgi:MinD-like ATPase involved in chromosome partitioning or flagellar assembly
MARIISVWGSPNSGKTTIATKLALKYVNKKYTVAIVYCDSLAPALPVLLPSRSKDNLFSLGAILESQSISPEIILKNTTTMKRFDNLLIYGYKDGESKLSYPRLTQYKVREFVRVLGEFVDYIIFDCSSDLDDIISNNVMQLSNAVLRLHTPDLKSVCWASSQLVAYGTTIYGSDRTVICLNNVENDGYYPSEEVKSYLKTKPVEIPFSRVIKQQFLSGEIIDGPTPPAVSKRLDIIFNQLEDIIENTSVEMDEMQQETESDDDFGMLSE